MKVLIKTFYFLFYAIVVTIAVILFLPVLPFEGNIQTKVVLSGSMEPAIHVGSVIVVKPSDTYAIGDVITFGEDTRNSIPTTHRVVDMRIESGTEYFQTKGDANPKADNGEIREQDVVGKVLFSIPFLGYLIDFAKKPIGFAFVIIIPAMIIILGELRKIIIEILRIRREKKQQ